MKSLAHTIITRFGDKEMERILSEHPLLSVIFQKNLDRMNYAIGAIGPNMWAVVAEFATQTELIKLRQVCKTFSSMTIRMDELVLVRNIFKQTVQIPSNIRVKKLRLIIMGNTCVLATGFVKTLELVLWNQTQLDSPLPIIDKCRMRGDLLIVDCTSTNDWQPPRANTNFRQIIWILTPWGMQNEKTISQSIDSIRGSLNRYTGLTVLLRVSVDSLLFTGRGHSVLFTRLSLDEFQPSQVEVPTDVMDIIKDRLGNTFQQFLITQFGKKTNSLLLCKEK